MGPGAPRRGATGHLAALVAALLLALAARPVAAYRVSGRVDEAKLASADEPAQARRAAVDLSQQRKQCIAREEMSTRVYPPEEFPTDGPDGYVVRNVAPATPLGDVHFLLHDLQITRLSAEASLMRKSDKVFSFALRGVGGEPMAMVKAWVEGLSFEMPDSSMDTIVRAISTTDSWMGFLTFRSRNYGQLENLKVSVNLSMSGDVRIDDDGNWELVEGTDKSESIFEIGSGGILLGVVNRLLKGQGGKGIEEAIFDQLWPMLMNVLPSNVGDALGTVPRSQGQIATTISLEASCRSPAAQSSSSGELRRCPDHLMDMTAKVTNTALVQPSPVLSELSRQGQAGLVSSLADAYEAGTGPVLGGLQGDFSVDLEITDKEALTLRARPSFDAPLSLLKALANNVRLEDFLPGVGKLSLEGGSLDARDGVIRVPAVRLDNVHLPVGVGEDTLSFRGSLEDFTVELEDNTGCMPEPGEENATELFDQLCKLVGKGSPLAVAAPGVTLSLDRVSGAVLEPSGGGDALAVGYSSDGVAEMLRGIDEQLARPGNVRNESVSPDYADSAVPMEFRRPHDRTLPKLDLRSVLQGLTISLGGSVAAGAEADELVEASVSANVTGTFYLGPPVLRGLTDGKDPDSGYLHLVVAGGYGDTTVTGFPSRLALARLTCGSLELYKLDSSRGSVAKDKPFDGEPHVTLDLAVDEDWSMLNEGQPFKSFGALRCFRIKEVKGWLFTADVQKMFCPSTEASGRSLEYALVTQQKRLKDAKRRTAFCRGDATECPAKPDGTWLVENDPYDRSTWPPQVAASDDAAMHASPAKQWHDAISAATKK